MRTWFVRGAAALLLGRHARDLITKGYFSDDPADERTFDDRIVYIGRRPVPVLREDPGGSYQ